MGGARETMPIRMRLKYVREHNADLAPQAGKHVAREYTNMVCPSLRAYKAFCGAHLQAHVLDRENAATHTQSLADVGCQMRLELIEIGGSLDQARLTQAHVYAARDKRIKE
jgi:hypothetical protein